MTKFSELYCLINPNKAGLFEGSFSWGWGQFDPLFIFLEGLIQYQYNLIAVVLLSKLVLSREIVKQMKKAALVLGLGKFIFVCIFRMNTQLHTQANHEIWHNFLSLYKH